MKTQEDIGIDLLNQLEEFVQQQAETIENNLEEVIYDGSWIHDPRVSVYSKYNEYRNHGIHISSEEELTAYLTKKAWDFLKTKSVLDLTCMVNAFQNQTLDSLIDQAVYDSVCEINIGLIDEW